MMFLCVCASALSLLNKHKNTDHTKGCEYFPVHDAVSDALPVDHTRVAKLLTEIDDLVNKQYK